MAQRLAEVLLVVIAGQRQDGAAVAQEGSKTSCKWRIDSRRRVGPGQFAEQVAGDEQHIDLFRSAVVGDALDGLAQIVGAVDAAEAVAEVPVGGVQDAHAIAPGSTFRNETQFAVLSHKRSRIIKLSSIVAGLTAGASSIASASRSAHGGNGIFTSIGSRKLSWMSSFSVGNNMDAFLRADSLKKRHTP